MAESYGKSEQADAPPEPNAVSGDPLVIPPSTTQSHSDRPSFGRLPSVKTSRLAAARSPALRASSSLAMINGASDTSPQTQAETSHGTSKANARHESVPCSDDRSDRQPVFPLPAQPKVGSPDFEDGLMAAIEGEVIPRLLLAYGQMAREDEAFDALLSSHQPGELSENGLADPDGLTAGTRSSLSHHAGLRVDPSDVAEFARILLNHDAPVAVGFVDMQIARGVQVADLLLDLCAPAARELGGMWERDECSFCEVTIGLSSLEHVILRCGGPEKTAMGERDHRRTVLLGAMPGNQHIFGLLIVKELFRRSGWMVQAPKASSAQALVDAVKANYFSIVGLSVGAVEDLPACQTLVKDIRHASCNPKLLVIVGGHGIQLANQDTRQLDVDLFARDGREGLEQIERMVSRLETSHPMN